MIHSHLITAGIAFSAVFSFLPLMAPEWEDRIRNSCKSRPVIEYIFFIHIFYIEYFWPNCEAPLTKTLIKRMILFLNLRWCGITIVCSFRSLSPTSDAFTALKRPQLFLQICLKFRWMRYEMVSIEIAISKHFRLHRTAAKSTDCTGHPVEKYDLSEAFRSDQNCIEFSTNCI